MEICWDLQKALYGTLPAGQDWQFEVTRVFVGVLGFAAARANPCFFYKKVSQEENGIATPPTTGRRAEAVEVRVCVHGDNIAAESELGPLVWLEEELHYLGDCPWEEDLAYARAVCDAAGVPREMMALVIMGFWLLNVTLGDLLVGFITRVEFASQAPVVWVFAGLMLVAGLIFGLRARSYKYQDYSQ